MKKIRFILMGVVCCLLSACMNDGWDEPTFSEPPFGNNDIVETNVISIASLIDKYPNVFKYPDQNKEITEDIQIKGRITGNDLGGNIYKQLAIQDETAAIIIAVNQNGLNGYLAEGQEILINLKGLHIGGYSKQPQIGAPYNGTSIGRMSKDIWMQHFKITDQTPLQQTPVDFNDVCNDMDGNCGKLVVLKDVSFIDADGKSTFAPADGSVDTSGGSYINRNLNESFGGKKVVVRTSTYADFAGMTLPYDTINNKPAKCKITGIATQFNSTWQILIRKSSDIEIIK